MTLLALARAGDEAALGGLLELYRNYLRLMARSLIDQGVQVRLDPSDLVQETFLKAHQQFAHFVGATEPELLAWLRQILVRNLADQARYDRRLRRKESFEAAHLTSPSARLEKRERAVLLADALEKSPEGQKRVRTAL